MNAIIATIASNYLGTAFNQLNILNHELGLPDEIIEKTAYSYRKARKRGLGRGRETSSALAAAVYLACRQDRTPRTLLNLSNYFRPRKLWKMDE
jgi:transcription initiation factor TFIIB